MGNGEPDELRNAREAARREREAADAAREESKRTREEAQRLRMRARDLERELREEQRRERDREREQRRERIRSRGPGTGPGPGPGFPPPPGKPHGFHTHFNVQFGDMDGAKAEQSFEKPEGIRIVHINQTAGKVLVRYCADGEVPGVVTAGNKTPPQLEVKRENGRVVVEVKLSTGWLFRRRQGANTVVRIPAGLDELKVDTGAGELDIREVAAASIRLSTGAGEIKALGTSGSISADAGAGKITLHAHRGLAKADAGAGDVLMDIAEVLPGEYRGNAGMGRVEMRLPAGHRVHIRATSGIGKSRVEYPSAGEDAPTSIRIESGIGEASVRVRREGEEPGPASGPGTSSVGSKPQRAGRAEATRRRRESEELRVLQLLEQGKITSAEAAELIAALQGLTVSQVEEEGSQWDEPPATMS